MSCATKIRDKSNFWSLDINFLTAFLSLPHLPNSFSMIISPYTSVAIITLIIHHRIIFILRPKLKTFFFLNPTFHKHLAPLLTDFTDIRGFAYAFCLYCLFTFSIFRYRYFLLFFDLRLLSLPLPLVSKCFCMFYITVFLSYFLSLHFPLKHLQLVSVSVPTTCLMAVFTSAKEVMFLPDFVCLSVCVSAR